VQEGVYANDVTPLEMIEDHLVIDRHEGLMGTFAALHPWLLADTADPLVRACGSITFATRPGVAPEFGIEVVAAPEQGTEESHFLRGGHRRGHRGGAQEWARRR